MLDNYLKHELEIEPHETKHVDEVYQYGLNVQGAPIMILLDEDDSVIDYVVGFNADSTDKLVAQM